MHSRDRSAAGSPNSQISTAGLRFGFEAEASKLGLVLGSLNSGGRKKKSGFPLWAPSETAYIGPASFGLTESPRHPTMRMHAAPASGSRMKRYMRHHSWLTTDV